MDEKIWAHTSDGGKVETLDEHSRAAADRARRFATKFDAGDFGLAAGLLHDLGKMKPGFQAKLRGETNSVSHSGEGARFAVGHYSRSLPRPFEAPLGRILAYVIAGHHAGLANGAAHGGGTLPLDSRLSEAESLQPWFPVGELPTLAKPPGPLTAAKSDPFGWAFFTRMLFSALVDADFLETERWIAEAEGRPIERGWQGRLEELKTRLDQHLSSRFGSSAADFDLLRLRAEVLADCRAAATLQPGLFSLTVPTGGGKTLSSLAFALDHALQHGLDRVIYVIPFTSIVEQTAQVFREALQDGDAILEHHSAFDSEKLERLSTRDGNFGSERLRLAAQNWDRPIVVTTAVQFFESLFAARTGKCRKLHNIARSVIILDEAQTLPLKLLRPCLSAINELARGYRTSVMLCTATQPAVRDIDVDAPWTLKNVREIVDADRNPPARLKRVRAEIKSTMTDGDLIAALAAIDQGLVIVNSRRHARELFEAMRKAGLDGARHLTTAMTAAHRQDVLERIRADLSLKRHVRLVATSLIEAGVDISFKAVWRAWAGLDQIVQAAGRCNRNGELGPEGGLLTIFEPEPIEGRAPPRELDQNAGAAKRVLRDGIDPLSEEAVKAYFGELLWIRNDGNAWARLDDVKVGAREVRGIIKSIDDAGPGLDFPFADIAEAFRLIEETMVPLIIPATAHPAVGAPKQLLRKLDFVPSPGGVARELQRFVVQIPRRARANLLATAAAHIAGEKKFGDQFVVLTNCDLYDADRGLRWDDPSFHRIEALMM